MKRKKTINQIFDEMIDDMKYIKTATFTRKFKTKNKKITQ